jgi:hypothetical protein
MTILTLRDLGLVGAATGALWTPSQITTALWLDAADASTITTVSGAVSQWNDKSGNGRNATQATAANRPNYSANTISFDGSNDSLQLSTPYGSVSQESLSVFSVASSSGTAIIIGTADLTILGWRTVFQLRPADASSSASNLWNYGINDANYYASSLVVSGSSIKSWRDGNAVTSITGTRSLWNFGGIQYIARGDGSTGTTVYAIDIREIVIATNALSDATRQLIEGYLAHKWGLTANRPSDHPYKTAPPLV